MVEDTSLGAYRDAVPQTREALYRQVLAYIRANPGATQVDISQHLGESARKRVPELVGPHVGDLMVVGKVRRGKLLYKSYQVRSRDAVFVQGCEQMELPLSVA